MVVVGSAPAVVPLPAATTTTPVPEDEVEARAARDVANPTARGPAAEGTEPGGPGVVGVPAAVPDRNKVVPSRDELMTDGRRLGATSPSRDA